MELKMGTIIAEFKMSKLCDESLYFHNNTTLQLTIYSFVRVQQIVVATLIEPYVQRM